MKRHSFIIFIILVLSFFMIKQVQAEEFHYPTESFSVIDSYQKNYIRSAYVSLSMTSNYIDEFACTYDLKTTEGYPVYQLSKNLKVPTSTEQFGLSSDNPVSVLDSGLLYILMHGYGYGKGEDSVFYHEPYGEIDPGAREYVTQIALWLYIYQNKERFKSSYCANEGCVFKDRFGEVVSFDDLYTFVKKAGEIPNYSYLKYIPDLVDKANTYVHHESSISTIQMNDLNYSFNNDGSLMMTDMIHPTPVGNKSNYLYYTISLEDPNQYGAYLVDSNNQEIFPNTQMTGPFKVVVPIQDNVDNMNLKSISVRIQSYFYQEKIFEYHVTSSTNPTSNTYSNILFSYIPNSEVITNTFTLRNFIQVSALSPSSEDLSGVTMILKSKNDPTRVIQTWVSRDTPHQLYLEDGDCTLCEESTPNGFVATTKCVDFVVDGEKVTYLRMQNEQQVEVPDTGIMQSNAIYWLGSLTMFIGLTVMCVTLLKKNKKV